MNTNRECPIELVAQRVRNRIIEQLQWICDPSDAGVGPDEMFMCWWDWVDEDNPRKWKDRGLYTVGELKAIEEVNHALSENWNDAMVCDRSNIQFMGTQELQNIQRVATAALGVFMVRGKLSEEKIQWFPLDDGS